MFGGWAAIPATLSTRFGNGIEFSDWSDGAVTEHNVVKPVSGRSMTQPGHRVEKYIPEQRMYMQRNISFHHNIVGHASIVSRYGEQT